jgi:hypothetical protein
MIGVDPAEATSDSDTGLAWLIVGRVSVPIVGAVPDVSIQTSPLIALDGSTDPIQMTATDTGGRGVEATAACVTVEL